MVMDQWQASLMRALAQLQLKTSPAARSQVEQKFDMQDDELGEHEDDELEAEGETQDADVNDAGGSGGDDVVGGGGPQSHSKGSAESQIA